MSPDESQVKLIFLPDATDPETVGATMRALTNNKRKFHAALFKEIFIVS